MLDEKTPKYPPKISDIGNPNINPPKKVNKGLNPKESITIASGNPSIINIIVIPNPNTIPNPTWIKKIRKFLPKLFLIR